MLFLMIHPLLTKTTIVCFDRLLCSQLCRAPLQKRQGEPGHGGLLLIQGTWASSGPPWGKKRKDHGDGEAQGAEPGGLIFTACQCNEEERAARTWASEEIAGLYWGPKCTVLCLVIQKVIEQIKTSNESA